MVPAVRMWILLERCRRALIHPLDLEISRRGLAPARRVPENVPDHVARGHHPVLGISKINAILPEIQRNPEYLSSLFSSFSPSLFEIFSNLPALD